MATKYSDTLTKINDADAGAWLRNNFGNVAPNNPRFSNGWTDTGTGKTYDFAGGYQLKDRATGDIVDYSGAGSPENKRLEALSSQIQSGQISSAEGTRLANTPIAGQLGAISNNNTTAPKADTYFQRKSDGKVFSNLVDYDPNMYSQVSSANGNTSSSQNVSQGTSPVGNQMASVPKPSFSLTGGNLKVGSSGTNVSQLQTLLGGLTVDGKYGPKTQQAVMDFQTKNGLKADGIVGPLTMAALNKQGQGTQTKAPDDPSNQFNTTTGQTNPNFQNQTGAITDPTNTNASTDTTGATGGTSQTDYEAQYKALIGQSPEELAAQKAIDDRENRSTQGQLNVEQQPIADSFISGQQAAIAKQATFDKIPLQQQLANAQAKRQAALDSVKFSLERSDKKAESVTAASKEAKDEAFRQAQLAETIRNNNLEAKKSNGTTINNILPSSQDLNTKETSEALMSVNQINNVLDNPDFDSAFGLKGLINRQVPGSAAKTIVALTTQILDKAAVAARGQLKGQGQVSNFEVQMLKNAQSSLSDYSIAPSAARQALIDMQGAIQTSTGGKANVSMTDKNGKTVTLSADSRGITKAIADGLKVKYIR